MIAVAFTVSCQRPDYLKQALVSWCEVRGTGQAQFIFCLEPGTSFPVSDFTKWAAGQFPHCIVEVNKARRGCMGNTRRALERSFETGAEFAIVAEEDVQVSSDILEYFSWAQKQYLDDQDTVAVCAHSKSAAAAESASVVRAPWFNPLIWGTWPDKWQEFILPRWESWAEHSQAWDGYLKQAVAENGKYSIHPVRSRSRHFGRTSTLVPWAFQDNFYERALSTSFSRDYPPQEYQETSFERDDLGLVI